MRIAVAGFQHESNTFARCPTPLSKFQEHCLVEGGEMVGRWKDAHHEVGGFLQAGRDAGFEAVPILMASATPAGPVEHDAVELIAARIIDGIQAARADGCLLALHGAMVTTSEPSGDSFVLRKIRQELGSELPIVVTLDFHANCTAEMIEHTNAIVVYQTNPHTDMRETGLEAGRLIDRLVRGEVRPAQALRKPHLIIPINHQATAAEPLRSLLAHARAIESRDAVLRANLVAGFPYADVPEMGPAILIVVAADQRLADQTADELTEALVRVHDQFAINLPGPSEAVRLAMQSETAPVVLADFGDNTGGGSPADGTWILEQLVYQHAAQSVVTIADPASVEQCIAAGVGNRVVVRVGGKTDELHGQPVLIEGTVRSLHDGKWIEPAPRHGGVRFNDQGLTAVVNWGSDNLLCLSTRRYPPFSLGQITALGIDPTRQQILVVKSAIAFRAAYEPIAGRIIEVDTPGLTAVNPAHFAYHNIRRPIWPLDPLPLSAP